MSRVFAISYLFLLVACSQSDNKFNMTSEQNKQSRIDQFNQATSVLSNEQQAAFDALNTIQTSTDEMNRLYSSFAGAAQSCNIPDTIMIMKQNEFQEAMLQFIQYNCKRLSAKDQRALALNAAKAQDEYTIRVCFDEPVPASNADKYLRNGTWLIPNVLGRRDVVIEW